jgi:hypothetical protein
MVTSAPPTLELPLPAGTGGDILLLARDLRASQEAQQVDCKASSIALRLSKRRGR